MYSFEATQQPKEIVIDQYRKRNIIYKGFSIRINSIPGNWGCDYYFKCKGTFEYFFLKKVAKLFSEDKIEEDFGKLQDTEDEEILKNKIDNINNIDLSRETVGEANTVSIKYEETVIGTYNIVANTITINPTPYFISRNVMLELLKKVQQAASLVVKSYQV